MVIDTIKKKNEEKTILALLKHVLLSCDITYDIYKKKKKKKSLLIIAHGVIETMDKEFKHA